MERLAWRCKRNENMNIKYKEVEVKETITLTSGCPKYVLLDLDIDSYDYDSKIIVLIPNIETSSHNISLFDSVSIINIDGKKSVGILARYDTNHLGDTIVLQKGYKLGYIYPIDSEEMVSTYNNIVIKMKSESNKECG